MALRTSQQPRVSLGLAADIPSAAKGAGAVEGMFFYATDTNVLSMVVNGAWVTVGSSSLSNGIMKFSGTVAGATAAPGVFLADSISSAGTALATAPEYVVTTARTIQNIKGRIIVNNGAAGNLNLYKNGVAVGGATIAFLANTIQTVVIPGTYLFAANDRISINVDTAAGGSVLLTVTVEYKG